MSCSLHPLLRAFSNSPVGPILLASGQIGSDNMLWEARLSLPTFHLRFGMFAALSRLGGHFDWGRRPELLAVTVAWWTRSMGIKAHFGVGTLRLDAQ